MTIFKMSPDNYEKWIYQNNADVSDFVEGTLLDSVLVDCKRGRAALFETAVNCWTSTFTVYYAAYTDPAGVAALELLWDNFAGAALVYVSGGAA